jgi:hypothetical protein
MKFSDENIRELFGFEDAESENLDRLQQYYLKNDVYNQMMAELPLRILVGKKGTGKSALIRIAMEDASNKGNLTIMVRPDDISEVAKEKEDFLLTIRKWKYGLTQIVGEKVLDKAGIWGKEQSKELKQSGIALQSPTKLAKFVYDTFSTIHNRVDIKPAQKLIMENYLKNNKIVVYIDDLDRGWQGKKEDIERMSALLNALRDLSNDRDSNISFKLALRTDVYYLVRTSDESTDKIEGAVIWYQWTNHEILAMFAKRVATYLNIPFHEDNLGAMRQDQLLDLASPIIDTIYHGYGKWENAPMYRILYAMIRQRPRDMVKLVTLAAKDANENNSEKITTDNLSHVFCEYSRERMQDTINEYKSELKNIENLLYGMKPTAKQKERPFLYDTAGLLAKLNNIRQNSNFALVNKARATSKSLAQFLYKTDFIIARKRLTDEKIQRIYFNENNYLMSDFVDFGYDWEVHPAFRWAMQPDSPNTIIASIALSD